MHGSPPFPRLASRERQAEALAGKGREVQALLEAALRKLVGSHDGG